MIPILHQSFFHLTALAVLVTAAAETTFDQCFAAYGKREFLPPGTVRAPPILYSFPGSGNTWVRLLVEHATGYYTSSPYMDKSLLPLFPGEFSFSNNKTVLLKLHPQITGYPYPSFLLNHSTVVLLRDPFASIWSNYNIHKTRTHSKPVPMTLFNKERNSYWPFFANRTACYYAKIWVKHYYKIAAQQKHLFIRYEDLLDSSTKYRVLGELVDFLGFSTSEDRIKCAFVLSVKDSIYRKSKSNLIQEAHATIKDGFENTEFACNIWRPIMPFVRKYNYLPYNNASCGDYPTRRIC